MNTANNIQNAALKPQASDSNAPGTPPIRPVSGGSGTAQACAACKHQRRRCAPDCLLAPYFPANNQKEFLNVRTHFGVSNVVKILKIVEPNQRGDAVASIIYEANVRAIDPVGGCRRLIRDLEERIRFCKSELNSVLKQISIYRLMNGEKLNSNLYDRDLLSDEVPTEQFLNGKLQENVKPEVEKK